MADKVVQDGHTEGFLHRILAEAYFHQQEWAKANQSIQYAVKDGTDGPGYNLAGDIALKTGNKEEAVRMWQKAVELGFDDGRVKQKIAEQKTQ